MQNELQNSRFFVGKWSGCLMAWKQVTEMEQPCYGTWWALRKTMFFNAKSISLCINPSCPMFHVVSNDFGFITVMNLNRNKFPNLKFAKSILLCISPPMPMFHHNKELKQKQVSKFDVNKHKHEHKRIKVYS